MSSSSRAVAVAFIALVVACHRRSNSDAGPAATDSGLPRDGGDVYSLLTERPKALRSDLDLDWLRVVAPPSGSPAVAAMRHADGEVTFLNGDLARFAQGEALAPLLSAPSVPAPDMYVGWAAGDGGLYDFPVFGGLGYESPTDDRLRFDALSDDAGLIHFESCGTPVPTPAIGAPGAGAPAWVGFASSCELPCGTGVVALYPVLAGAEPLCLFAGEAGGANRALYLHPFLPIGVTGQNGIIRFFELADGGLGRTHSAPAPPFMRFQSFLPTSPVLLGQLQLSDGGRSVTTELVELEPNDEDGGVTVRSSALSALFSEIASITPSTGHLVAVGKAPKADAGTVRVWRVVILSPEFVAEDVYMTADETAASAPVVVRRGDALFSFWTRSTSQGLTLYGARVGQLR